MPTTPASGSMPLTPILSNNTALPIPATTLTKAEKAALEVEEHTRDLCTVRNELHRYKEEPLIPENVTLDLVSHWDESERVFPLTFKVALDILPVQAYSVPCERAFSSSKETGIMRRSLLSASMLEVLQVLKHLYKQKRLDFTSHWIANEEDYSIEKATEAAINELVSSAKCDELLDLLRNMDSAWQQ